MFLAPLLFALAGPAVQGLPPQPAGLSAHHHSGQTFLTWSEAPKEEVRQYRVYRHVDPIDELNLSEAQHLFDVPQDSGRFYADRYFRAATMDWAPRYLSRYVVTDGGAELAPGVGLFVWTLREEELAAGGAYYAITSVDASGVENVGTFGPANAIGPIAETADDPLPVLSKTILGGKAQIYTQFLDARQYNVTAVAPNSYNDWYGLDPMAPEIAAAIQYAYTYVVFAPYPGCTYSGEIDGKHPVVLIPHPFGGQKARPLEHDPAPTWCNAFRIQPLDPFNTWWFGHAREHDYRVNLTVAPTDTIENYTEARILRMVSDLARHPSHGPKVDLERVFVYGHSMGASGALALALRYPDVFAAAHASQPMTNYGTAGQGGGDDWVPDASVKFGPPAQALPMAIRPNQEWGAALAAHSGASVWDWQNHQLQLAVRRGDDFVPLGVDHSILDTIIEWPTQGLPAYAVLDAAAICWRGLVQSTAHVGSGIAAMPGPFGKDPDGLPFAGFRAVKRETVPGLSGSAANAPLPPSGVGDYNAHIDWSASWSDWDGAPLDEPTRWRMSLRTSTPDALPVDVTPRRLQAFEVHADVPYVWRTETLGGVELDSGWLRADPDDLLTVPDVDVQPEGTRLEIVPALRGSPATISLGSGGSQLLSLAASSANAGAVYFVLGSISGTSPALPLTKQFSLPLVFDAYTEITLSQPNSPILQPSLALLDARGEADCLFSLPPSLPAQFAGLTLNHAFLVLDGTGLALVSNAVPVVLVP